MLGAQAIAAALEINTSLEQLNLSGNGIYTDGAIAIAKSLLLNTSLQHLDLSSTELNYLGIK